MPSRFALINEMKFDRIAGLITHGHFDHDAACITGPRFDDDEPLPISYSNTSISSESEDLTPLVEEIFTNPRTGEETFRLMRKR